MKKPPYIEIRFSIEDKKKQAAAIKYFKLQENKVLKVLFAAGGRRKDFKYKVIFANLETYYEWGSNKKDSHLKLRLELVKEEKQNEQI